MNFYACYTFFKINQKEKNNTNIVATPDDTPPPNNPEWRVITSHDPRKSWQVCVFPLYYDPENAMFIYNRL